LHVPAKARLALITIFFALLVYHCFFVGLSSFGLMGPDEPRYASIAREMARSGDWITPRLNGSPWFEKPPLYYWSAAIGFRMFTRPEVAARAPSGVYALLAVLGIALLARRFYGPSVGNTVAWILPATVAMTGFAHAAATDMPFAATLTLAMAAAAPLLLVLDDEPSRPHLWAAAFGAALALATLAKGPAAIVLAGGSVALWAVATGNIRRSLRLFHPLALLTFFVVATPWYVLCALRNPDFLRIFFLEHNVERFLTNRYQHHQPFWFFVPVLLLAVFPWTLLLIPAIADAWRALRTADWRKSPGAFFASWAIFPFVFFSFSQSKLPGYILPAIPPLVLLLARALAAEAISTAPVSRLRRYMNCFTASPVLLGIGIATAMAPLLGSSLGDILDAPGLDRALITIGIALSAGGAAALLVARPRRGPALGAAVAGSVFAFCVGFAANHLLPLVGPELSPRTLALATRKEIGSATVSAYGLPRAWQYGCEFYLQQPLPEWTPETPHPGWIITTFAGSADLRKHGLRVLPVSIQTRSRQAELFHVE